MKWNWGKGIVLVMLGFMSFIMYFVIAMSTDEKYSHDLVTEEYYAKELAYQEEIDAETNAKDQKIQGEKTPEGWLLHFPKDIQAEKIKGKVFLYRPSNKKLDIDFPLVLSGSNLLIPDKYLLDGRWNITLQWEYDGTSFLYKEQIVY